MNGKRLLFVILGAALGAVICASVAKLLRVGEPGSLAMGIAGGIVGAFSGRAITRRQ